MRERWTSEELKKHVRFIDYRGKTPPKVEKGIRLITAKNVKMGYVQRNPIEFVDPNIYEAWMTRGIPCFGDVLFTTEAPLGNVAQLDTEEKVVIGQRLITMQPNLNAIDPTFLKYTLMSPQTQKEILSHSSGATVQGIKAKLLKLIQISYPPLPEQQRIVAILDEAFEGIATAAANAKKNLKNARELFESYLNAVFNRKNEGWVEKRLSEVLETQPRNGWSPPAKNHSYEGVPVLTLSSVTGFEFNLSKIKHTSAVTNNEAHYWINNDDLLISRSNTHDLVGHVAIVSGLQKPTIYPDLIMRMRVNKCIASTKFIYYQLRSRDLRHLISDSAQGANPTMKKINKRIVQELPITLPGLPQQEAITIALDTLSAKTLSLEAIYQKKLTALTKLKQSLLQKAFSGELTADFATAAQEEALA